MDVRSEEMIRYICAALVVCGKYYLNKNLNTRALSLFQKAAVTGTGRTRVLRDIIVALTAEKMAKDAGEFLLRFPADSQKGPDYLVSEYLIQDLKFSDGKSIELGRKLIQQGVQDVNVYRTLIKKTAAGGQREALDSFLTQAKKQFPDQAAEFDALVVAARTASAS